MSRGQKVYLYVGILNQNQKMALSSNADVAMSRTLQSNTDGLRIVTYNCRSVKSSIGSVRQLCRNSDIVMLQEHWLLPDDVGFFSCATTFYFLSFPFLTGRENGDRRA